MNKYIDVAETIDTPAALTQELGNIIYNEINTALCSQTTVYLDFKNVESIIVPFLNNAIGKLYKNHTSEEISTYLILENFPPEKNATLNVVINNAKKYYENQVAYDNAIREVINIE